MTFSTQNWGTIHPSVYGRAFKPARKVAATLRPTGAVRYRCPLTGSFVLLTDAPTLARCARGDVRLRCVDCGDMHLLTSDVIPDSNPAIVVKTTTP
jgi:hypothetical protein